MCLRWTNFFFVLKKILIFQMVCRCDNIKLTYSENISRHHTKTMKYKIKKGPKLTTGFSIPVLFR